MVIFATTRAAPASSAVQACTFATALWELKHIKHKEVIDARRKATKGHKAFERTDAEPNDRYAYDFFEPDFTCLTKTRVGASDFGDGPKFMCDVEFTPIKNKCLVYSVGSNGDFSFEAAIHRLFQCTIHTFDPTEKPDHMGEWKSKGKANHAVFHGVGLAGAESFITVKGMHDSTVATLHKGEDEEPNSQRRLMPLRNIVQHLGHDGKHIDVLKVDCEGCEYDAFDKIWGDLARGEYTIGQILVELHGTDFTKINSFFEGATEAGFYVFSKERNHWGCSGWGCVEYSLVHKETAQTAHMRLLEQAAGSY
jgi:hypothetical protein